MADRPALVLLHAWPLDARMWGNQITALGGDGMVLAPDLPGFGSEPAAQPSFDEWARRLAAKLRGQGVDKAVVTGCSMGGYVALALLRVDPTLLAGIALVSARLVGDSPVFAAARNGTISEIERLGSSFLVANTMLSLGHGSRKNPELVAAVQEMVSSAKPAALIAAYRTIGARPDMTAAVAQSQVPLAVIAGTNDVTMSIDEARAICAAVPRASFTEVPGAGHFSPMENPGAVTDALREFWNSAA
jgi:pimeloyl-ACP methyl ester carboxylesterase